MSEINFSRSLKPLAIEELLDFYFYRRVAHLMVPVLVKLKLSPNQITTISLFFGLFAAYLIFKMHFIFAGMVSIFAIFFDCCDGQVARITGQTSPIGRALDGFFDLVWIAALWLAIYFSGYFQTHQIEVFALMVSSGASMIFHCWRFDAVKIKYLELTSSTFNENDLDVYQALDVAKKELRAFNVFVALIALIMAFQMYFFVRGSKQKEKYAFSEEELAAHKKRMEPTINKWSYLGEGHHNSLVILGLLIAPLSPYGLITAFLFILIPMNLWWFYCEWTWVKRLKSLDPTVLIP